MKLKVTLNNFQIFEGEQEFDFEPGLTVITGPNASGKSTIFYAIKFALINPNGVSDCINYNSNKASVTIENNDNKLTWVRTLTSSEYITKENARFTNASNLDSRDICDLGFYFDNKNEVVNIHDEWSVLFPFGESDTNMFKLFEDIFNISCSFQIIDEMKKEESNVKLFITSKQQEKDKLQLRHSKLQEIFLKLDRQKVAFHKDHIAECERRASELREDYKLFSKYYPSQNIVLPKTFDVSNLNQQEAKVESILADLALYLKLNEITKLKLPEVKEIVFEESSITVDYTEYMQIKDQIKKNEQLLNEFNLKERQLLEVQSSIKFCPTCGQEIRS